MRAPKVIKVDALRSVIGDAETERLVTAYMVAIHGAADPAVQTIKVKPEQWEVAVALLTHPNGKNPIAALPAFRRFFAANPRMTKKFVGFANEILSTSEHNPEPILAAQKRSRRRVTSGAAE